MHVKKTELKQKKERNKKVHRKHALRKVYAYAHKELKQKIRKEV